MNNEIERWFWDKQDELKQKYKEERKALRQEKRQKMQALHFAITDPFNRGDIVSTIDPYDKRDNGVVTMLVVLKKLEPFHKKTIVYSGLRFFRGRLTGASASMSSDDKNARKIGRAQDLKFTERAGERPKMEV